MLRQPPSNQTKQTPVPRQPGRSATLTSRLHELIQAAFTGLWIQTHEPAEAIRDLTALCRTEGWRLGTWDCDRGMTFPLEPIQMPGVTDTQDPFAIIRALPQIANGSGTTLAVFENLHRFLGATEIVQALARQLQAGKNNRCFVVVLAPAVQIPPELDKLFTVIDHEPPGHAQLEEIARGIATQDGELPTGDDLARVIEAAAGLTASDGALLGSLVGQSESNVRAALKLADAMAACVVFAEPETLWELKSQQLKKSGLVSLHRGSTTVVKSSGSRSIPSIRTR
jgi:hypothetical protein